MGTQRARMVTDASLPAQIELGGERSGQIHEGDLSNTVLVAIAGVVRVPELARESALGELEAGAQALVWIGDPVVLIAIVPAVEDELHRSFDPRENLGGFRFVPRIAGHQFVILPERALEHAEADRRVLHEAVLA